MEQGTKLEPEQMEKVSRRIQVIFWTLYLFKNPSFIRDFTNSIPEFWREVALASTQMENLPSSSLDMYWRVDWIVSEWARIWFSIKNHEALNRKWLLIVKVENEIDELESKV